MVRNAILQMMPNLPNAKKALRQSKKHQMRNRQYKNRIKKLYRQISDLSNENKTKEAIKLLPTYYKAVDKAAKKNILHKNTAARKKSFVTKLSAGKTSIAKKTIPKKEKATISNEQGVTHNK